MRLRQLVIIFIFLWVASAADHEFMGPGGSLAHAAFSQDYKLQDFTFNPTSGVSNRLITPNGDGLNDFAVFTFDNPRDSSVSGKIYDIQGKFVTDMSLGPNVDSLMWDGKIGGSIVATGVYVYLIEAESKIYTGTVVVIR